MLASKEGHKSTVSLLIARGMHDDSDDDDDDDDDDVDDDDSFSSSTVLCDYITWLTIVSRS
jgi:hypothetical protein